MVMVFEGTDNQYSMDGYLESNLKIIKDKVKKDWDFVIVVDGPEGSGKSIIAQQAAYFLDPTLDLSRITFSPKEFRDAILKADKYTAVIFDEAYRGLSSRAAMSEINRTLISMLAEIRQKNLFVFVVMPTFFDLDKYVSLWRSRALIHVYTGDNFERGFFSFYNVDRKKSLFVLGKKYYSYYKPKPNFRGRFPNHYVVNERSYRQKKLDSLNGTEKLEGDAEFMIKYRARLLDKVMSLGDKLPLKVKLKLLELSEPTYYRRVNEYKEALKFTQSI